LAFCVRNHAVAIDKALPKMEQGQEKEQKKEEQTCHRDYQKMFGKRLS
jgi:hypothetical protein